MVVARALLAGWSCLLALAGCWRASGAPTWLELRLPAPGSPTRLLVGAASRPVGVELWLGELEK